MADTTEGKIAEALKAHTVSLAQSMQLPLSWLGWDFNVPANGRFLRAEHTPNVTNREFIGSDEPHQYLGILQISVHAPHGEEEPALRELAGKVVAHFACDLPLIEDNVEVRIIKRPSTPGFITDDVDLHIPVMIEYECWA